jgi:small subunit ribosomal protein S11
MGKKRIAQQDEESGIGGAVGDGEGSKSIKKRGKGVAQLRAARIYIAASYNNTVVSITDSSGNMLAWASAGAMGFKGPKKATPYAASKVVENVFEKMGNATLGQISLYVQGVGSGRDASIRAIAGRGLEVVSIQDRTPIPHNGCRPKKARRV